MVWDPGSWGSAAISFVVGARNECSGRCDLCRHRGWEQGGSLYTLNQTTGLATLVGPLVDAACHPYALTALAFDPLNGKLYGGTNRGSATAPSSLVTVDPLTSLVTLIGGYNLFSSNTLADLSFRADGTLYGWEAAPAHELVTVDPATGAATVVPGALPFSGFGGGGLAFDLGGTLYSTPDGSSNPPGTLRTVNPANGHFLTVHRIDSVRPD